MRRPHFFILPVDFHVGEAFRDVAGNLASSLEQNYKLAVKWIGTQLDDGSTTPDTHWKHSGPEFYRAFVTGDQEAFWLQARSGHVQVAEILHNRQHEGDHLFSNILGLDELTRYAGVRHVYPEISSTERSVRRAIRETELFFAGLDYRAKK